MARVPKAATEPAGPRLVRKPDRRTIARRTPVAPAQEQIAIRAYELYLADGAVHGRDLDHWFRAEQEVLESASPARPAKRAAGARTKG